MGTDGNQTFGGEHALLCTEADIQHCTRNIQCHKPINTNNKKMRCLGYYSAVKEKKTHLFLKQTLPSFPGSQPLTEQTDIEQDRSRACPTPSPSPQPSNISGLDPQRLEPRLLEEARGPPSAREGLLLKRITDGIARKEFKGLRCRLKTTQPSGPLAKEPPRAARVRDQMQARPLAGTRTTVNAAVHCLLFPWDRIQTQDAWEKPFIFLMW